MEWELVESRCNTSRGRTTMHSADISSTHMSTLFMFKRGGEVDSSEKSRIKRRVDSRENHKV